MSAFINEKPQTLQVPFDRSTMQVGLEEEANGAHADVTVMFTAL
jgi:hypothetical protein